MKKVLIFLALSVILASVTIPAQAVIPALVGPLAALISVLPQILAVVGIGLLAIFKTGTYRTLLTIAWQHKIITAIILLSATISSGFFIYQAVSPRPNITTITSKNLPSSSTNQSWATFRGGTHRTGHQDNHLGPADANLLWTFKDQEAVAMDFSSSPAVVGDRLYIGAGRGSLFRTDGLVYCLDVRTGDVIWKSQSHQQIFSSPAIVGGRVYIGEGLHYDVDSCLRCLDADTGQEIWNFQTASHVESSPCINQGRVYFGAGDDGVYCLDALEGKEIWHYTNLHVDISPIAVDGNLYFGTGYGQPRIYAVSAENGSDIWVKSVDLPVWGSPTISEELIYFGLGKGNFVESHQVPAGGVIALNLKTREEVWSFKTADAVLTAISFMKNYVYFGCRDGYVYALEAKTGDVVWKTPIDTPIVSSPAVTKDSIYFGGTNGVIYCLETKTGDMNWWYNTDDVSSEIKIYSSPAVANGKLYIGSSDRYLFCLGDAVPTN